ncbi:hypothetical protein G9F73_012415 [Clostridium estertheticum]|uniref:hypothetical protein n=1 Tax=Clostridium estertheticum TaxID=238834 RepID=UPI0013EE6B71|nr:hypothetical protein [Clostridium estertheticum]MBZ9608612.1 hypothetical protein [Clostridium estertheticum]
MDSIRDIAISQIASVLSGSNIIPPKNDIWEKIFNNAGQSELYIENRFNLKCTEIPGTWGRDYEHNCYSSLHKILISLIEDFGVFTKLINSIVDEINMYCILTENKSKLIEKLDRNSSNKNNALLNEYANKEFKHLRTNLNILGLDFSFDKEESNHLIVLPFEFTDKTEEKSILMEWLETNYVNILVSYKKAISAYGISDYEGTLTHCRSVLTGIFSYSKEDNTKWLRGLQVACEKDKNLKNVEKPNKIHNLIFIKRGDVEEVEYESLDRDKKYNYPRFRTIYQLYSFLSDLGPHITEAPKINGVPDTETIDMCDALMGLRMTEDVLIWLCQCEKINYR